VDQFEREDSSNYTEPERPSVAEPVRDEPVQPPVQQAPKPKKSKAPLVLTLLLLLALVAAATFGWMWFQQSGRVDNLEADLSKARNDVSRLETAAKAEDSLKDETVTTDTEDSDSEALIKTAIAYASAEVGVSNVQATLKKQSGDFAIVTIKTSNTSSGQFLKKSNDQWVVIWASEVGISDEAIEKYGIPKELTVAN
jgi:uncharacterized protein HemX